jgi:hypothetical protein
VAGRMQHHISVEDQLSIGYTMDEETRTINLRVLHDPSWNVNVICTPFDVDDDHFAADAHAFSTTEAEIDEHVDIPPPPPLESASPSPIPHEQVEMIEDAISLSQAVDQLMVTPPRPPYPRMPPTPPTPVRFRQHIQVDEEATTEEEDEVEEVRRDLHHLFDEVAEVRRRMIERSLRPRRPAYVSACQRIAAVSNGNSLVDL